MTPEDLEAIKKRCEAATPDRGNGDTLTMTKRSGWRVMPAKNGKKWRWCFRMAGARTSTSNEGKNTRRSIRLFSVRG